ncbi:hypothetical protein C8F04DRAFT_1403701 [Mycena alexandri]|uniref:F-box domain-containing protein n=1 Tax=Mycena alexandri TaxID=1745969 RepID=A0AAD6S4G5_9AGAR|nr:hypothetical protein C8F04DRAFT_1403701 [Mycena alexandri]
MLFAPTASPSSEPLVEDVLLHILSFCDIVSVLAMTESSKYFYRLASSKSVWLAAVTELFRRGFVHREEDEVLHELSKDQLVEKAKRAALGPQTWRRNHFGPPIVSTEITLHTHNNSRTQFGVHLLPGGNYLFHNHSVLDCWRILERKIVWTYDCTENARVLTFAAQLTDNPNQAVIMACQRTRENNEIRRNYVEMLTLDLKAGKSQSLIVARAPNGPGGDDTYSHPQICGDFAAVAVGFEVVLLNWREGTYAMVHIGNDLHFFSSFSHLALAPGYAILVVALSVRDEAGDEYEVQTLALSPLAALPWAPVDRVNPPKSVTSGSDLPRVHSEALPLLGEHTSNCNILISAHEHPLRNDLFRVWIYVDEVIPSVLLSYNLDLRGDPTLGLRSTTNIGDFHIHGCGVSFSGHTVRSPS